MVIFHSYVSLPEGSGKKNTQKSRLWYGVNLRAMILRNN